jgi:hypothetical protein
MGNTLAGDGVGGPNSGEGTDTLVLYVYYYNPSTVSTVRTFKEGFLVLEVGVKFLIIVSDGI